MHPHLPRWLLLAGVLAVAPVGVRAGDCNPCPDAPPVCCVPQTTRCPGPKVVVDMCPPEIVFRQAPAAPACADHSCRPWRHAAAPCCPTVQSFQTLSTYAVPQAMQYVMPPQAMTFAAPQAVQYQAVAPQAVQYQAVAPQAVSYQAVQQVAVQQVAVQAVAPVQQFAMQAVAPVQQAVPVQQFAVQSYAVAPTVQAAQSFAVIGTQAQAAPSAVDLRAAAAYLASLKSALAAAQADAAPKAEASAQAADGDCCKQIDDLKRRIDTLTDMVGRQTIILERHNNILKQNNLIK